MAAEMQQNNASRHDDVMAYGTESLSTLLTICEGNPDGFPSKRAIDSNLKFYLMLA